MPKFWNKQIQASNMERKRIFQKNRDFWKTWKFSFWHISIWHLRSGWCQAVQNNHMPEWLNLIIFLYQWFNCQKRRRKNVRKIRHSWFTNNYHIYTEFIDNLSWKHSTRIISTLFLNELLLFCNKFSFKEKGVLCLEAKQLYNKSSFF